VRVRTKHLAFAAAAAVLASLVGIASLFAVDLYLHKRTERSAGLNRWGYRGVVAGRKRPGEIRVAVLGGSTVFGYGVTWESGVPRSAGKAAQRPAGPTLQRRQSWLQQRGRVFVPLHA